MQGAPDHGIMPAKAGMMHKGLVGTGFPLRKVQPKQSGSCYETKT